MKIVTVMPIFSGAHMIALGRHAEHILICPETHLPELPAEARTRVVPLRMIQILPRFLAYLLGGQTSIPQAYWRIGRVLSREQPDAIVITDFFHWYFWQCERYTRRHTSARLFLYSETKQLPKNPLSRVVMQLFLWRLRHVSTVRKIFTFSEQGSVFFAKHVPDVAVSVLPTPIDTELFTPTRPRLSLQGGTLRILMNARYVPYKRHKDLLLALVRLQHKSRLFHLTLVGRLDEGRAEIESLVEKLNLINVVTFRDPVSLAESPELYRLHDVLVLPSYNEAIGMVVPEAMACGLPTITSDTIGANIYVEDGTTGIVFKTGDVALLEAALERCFDSGFVQAMGKRARARIEHFAVEPMTECFFREIEDTR